MIRGWLTARARDPISSRRWGRPSDCSPGPSRSCTWWAARCSRCGCSSKISRHARSSLNSRATCSSRSAWRRSFCLESRSQRSTPRSACFVGATAPPKRLVDQWVQPSWRGRIELAAASAIPALAITAYFALRVPRVRRELDLAWLLPIALLLSMLIVLVALRLRANLAAAYRTRWNERRPIIWMTLVVWLAALPACLVFAGTFPLLPAKVCTTTGSARTGLLIGETNQRIYIGERYSAKRRVISFPMTQVTRTFIGGNARLEHCG